MKNLDFDIDEVYIAELNEKQNGKCAYSGITLNWEACPSGTQRVCPADRVSIDRIDRDKGYIRGNVQLVTVIANYIKGHHKEAELIEFCRTVAERYKDY